MKPGDLLSLSTGITSIRIWGELHALRRAILEGSLGNSNKIALLLAKHDKFVLVLSNGLTGWTLASWWYVI